MLVRWCANLWSSTLARAAPSTCRYGTRSIATTPDKSVAGASLGRGLEEFFDNDKGWVWKDKDLPTGRAWLAAELRSKSFEDLHKLWWICVKEQNKLCSQKDEARRFSLIFPHKERIRQVRLTMSRIKMVLWERKTAWEQAQELLKLEKMKTELLAKHGHLSKTETAGIQVNSETSLDNQNAPSSSKSENQLTPTTSDTDSASATPANPRMSTYEILKLVAASVPTPALGEAATLAALGLPPNTQMHGGSSTPGKGRRSAVRSMYGYKKKLLPKGSSWYIV